MASSASGQDEPNRALRLATRCIPQAKFHQKPYNKSFIDQFCSVNMAGYWPRSFFSEFLDLDVVSVHKHAKKELGQYPAMLTSHLVNNPYLLNDVVNHKNYNFLACDWFKMSYFPLIRLPSCYRTVCYWIVCYWTV